VVSRVPQEWNGKQEKRKTASDFEDTLKIDARNDVTTAGAFLSSLVRRQSMSAVKTFLTNGPTNDQSTIEAQVATCIQNFLNITQANGRARSVSKMY
jgi:hypothetical protein